MIDLCLSVLFSSFLFVIFKLFGIYKIQTVNAIIVNYITASIVGSIFYDGDVILSSIPNKPWFIGAALLGILFFVVFNLMARCSQEMGVSVASVATKMSLVIPVLAGVWIYHESLSATKVIGIFMALAAVYFASMKDDAVQFNARHLILPFLVFTGSGIIDVCIKYMEEFYVEADEFPIFSGAAFASAAVSGITFLAIKNKGRRFGLRRKDIIGGICLGVPNFFSIYFLLRALQNPQLNSASIFTVNNVAIVMLTTLLGIVIFKEKVTKKNWGGILLAVVSIILVALY